MTTNPQSPRPQSPQSVQTQSQTQFVPPQPQQAMAQNTMRQNPMGPQSPIPPQSPLAPKSQKSATAQKNAHPVRKTILIALAVIVALIVAWVAIIAIQAQSVMHDAKIAETSLENFSDTVERVSKNMDTKQIAHLEKDQNLAQAAKSLANVDRTLNGPLWTPLTHLPSHGNDVILARGLASAGHKATADILPTYLHDIKEVLTGSPNDSDKIIKKLNHELPLTNAKLDAVTKSIKTLPKGSISQLESARKTMLKEFTEVSSAVDKATNGLSILAQFLG